MAIVASTDSTNSTPTTPATPGFGFDYDAFSAWAHTGLSVGGAVPAFGIVPDAIDSVFTAAEIPFGKSTTTDLGFAAAGLAGTFLPIFGDGPAAAAKIAARAARNAKIAARTARNADEALAAGKAATAADDAAKAADDAARAVAPNKTRWDYINEWHDKRATELFGNKPGQKLKGREYDKLYKGRDIEHKSDNFSKGPRSQDSIDRMNGQITKDIENLKSGTANPHWHFEHDPRVAPEMAPLLKRLEDAGITWTWGSSTPTF